MNELDIERKKLDEITQEFYRVINYLDKREKTLIKELNPDRQEMYDLLEIYHNKHRVMKESLKKPYFARIDFKTTEKEEQCYISKVGVTDEDHNLITVDWRSPIASLYYDSNVGEASYQAHENVFTGEMTLKRQYNIEDSKLIEYLDVDTVTSDELLNPYLGKTKDTRLKNIVSSIQSEQNKIIRHPLYEHTLVQGVAGSGKTTVALHRIAYLAYNYKDQIKRNQFLVIGPNNFFLDYISDVLPDLDVTHVGHFTFQSLVEKIIKEKVKINNNQSLIENLEDKLKRYYKSLEQKLIESDFYINETKIISGMNMKKILNEIEDHALFIKTDHLIKNLNTRIRHKQDTILEILDIELNNKFQNNLLSKTEYIKEYNKLKKELANGGTNYLKKHFIFIKKKITTLYNDFLKENGIKRVGYTDQDLNGLLYLGIRILGNTDYRKIKHAVIDEAQDYDFFRFQLLKELMSNCYFSIFGDLAQSISEHPTITSWEDILSLYQKPHMDYLLKSYRTTVEIMNEANKILEKLNMKTSEPVIRHGLQPIYINEIDINVQLEQWKKEYKSIAIITKTEDHAIKLSKQYHLSYINELSQNNKDQIVSLSVKTSKGLEFDAVIVLNADEYKNGIELNQLYVAMTRPLHELIIQYNIENETVKMLK